MSFWGATVITSLASAIPVVGDTIVTWLWNIFQMWDSSVLTSYAPNILLIYILIIALFDS
jgi:ubiquinol-cytochrome c reductase cytochrome b subunit